MPANNNERQHRSDLLLPIKDSYRYSYSGSDARIFAWFLGRPDQVIELDAVHTVSCSVHEAKGDARALGYRNVKGRARGIRTIAGSMIMLVINDHPLRPLFNLWGRISGDTLPEYNHLGSSLDYNSTGIGKMLDSYHLNTRLPTLLPPFEIGIQYSSELSFSKVAFGEQHFRNRPVPTSALPRSKQANVAGTIISGIEFVDYGMVTSTNDMVTEVTFSYKAYDHKVLSAVDFGYNDFIDYALKQPIDYDRGASVVTGPADIEELEDEE